MRLVRLKVRNIASLKGEHEINFQEIERQSPLFAITGETGSGKSSVLNSIGLALYGQIYKKNFNQLDVVTLGEKEGLVELIFQVKGKYYLADWRAKVRKQNGEPYSTPQTPVRNLYSLEGDLFSSPKNIATTSVSELLNLDFDQFTKCIILNQGEFAKFLTSSFTDRKEILEKLYPGEMLESMGRELKLELDTLQKAKESLEIELQTLKGDNLSGEVLKEQKEALTLKIQNLDHIFKRIEELDYHFVSLDSNHRKFAENEQRIGFIKKEMGEHTTNFNTLIKKGEILFQNKEETQKELEARLPGLQLLLKEEENLKNSEEGLRELESKGRELKSSSEKIQKDLARVEVQLNDSNTHLKEKQGELTLNLASLKALRPHFDELFELFNEKVLLEEEIKGKKELLETLEAKGKELKERVQTLESKIQGSPEELKVKERKLEAEKKELNLKIEKFKRHEILAQELALSLKDIHKETEENKRRLVTLSELIKKAQEDLSPIETTLKLQEVMAASSICISHALLKDESSCPVCHHEVGRDKWQELKSQLDKTDLISIRVKADELTRLILTSKEEEKLLQQKDKALLLSITEKQKSLIELEEQLKEKLPTVEDLDQTLSDIKKLIWENEATIKEISKLNSELMKAREIYSLQKNDLTSREENLSIKHTKLDDLSNKTKILVPTLNKESIQLLKREARILQDILQLEATLDKIRQEEKFLTEQRTQRESELKKTTGQMSELSSLVAKLKLSLNEALKGQKASDLIQELNQKAKSASLLWSHQEQEQRKQELQIKEFQSRLYELDKLTKDYDLAFTKELHTIRELGVFTIKVNRPETENLLGHFQKLSLELRSPRELFIPLQDILKTEREFYKHTLSETKMEFATVSARFEDWEKLQDKILINQMKARDLNEKFERRERLYEVLGKDELRTFVLSLVEENLIQQTNQELQKLCQGRYEILHQSRRMKMTPEFFILDKFREGQIRKISTLSGGETFMVSLAMALGLAEMTRGQAEIDSLFIDEGFGTLDQESLEDVLDMLQQIQNRGLMVGIISHIKALTAALPVNLVLTKKSDGTSTVSIRH